MHTDLGMALFKLPSHRRLIYVSCHDAGLISVKAGVCGELLLPRVSSYLSGQPSGSEQNP